MNDQRWTRFDRAMLLSILAPIAVFIVACAQGAAILAYNPAVPLDFLVVSIVWRTIVSFPIGCLVLMAARWLMQTLRHQQR